MTMLLCLSLVVDISIGTLPSSGGTGGGGGAGGMGGGEQGGWGGEGRSVSPEREFDEIEHTGYIFTTGP